MNRKPKKNGSDCPVSTPRDQIEARGVGDTEQHCVTESEKNADHPAKKPKVEVCAQASRENPISVRGALAPNGQRWIQVTEGERSTWVARRDFGGQAMAAEERLRNSDITFVGYGSKKHLLDAVKAIAEYAPVVLADRSGWIGGQVVLPDGQVISPAGVAPVEVVFAVDPTKCQRSGTAVGWRRQVAGPLTDYDLPSFLLMMPFAAPLLALTDRTDNIGFELVGVGGRGKSTLQHLAASAVGAPDGQARYWVSLETSLAGLELQMPIHNDLPLILDEANLYLASTTEGGESRHMRNLAFKLANGQAKLRHGAAIPTARSRFVWLISANESFRAVAAAARGEGFRAAADRLLTLTMPDRQSGAIDRIPAGYASSGAFMDAIKAAAVRHHGVAMPRFLQRLVDRRHRDEAGLRQMIATGLADFRAAAGINENDGSARRVADAFGLVAVAGQAAVEYRVLPRNFRCMEAALACYQANRNS